MAKQSPERAAVVAAPDLETKSTPSRRKGKTTFEAILVTTGELLAEVGFERLNTNLVCERAGVTPPALYRYFPNKYALLAELARRLMDAQDEVLFSWLDRGDAAARTLEESVAKGIELWSELVQVTRNQPGGMSILRAIRSVPVLQEVRIESRDRVVARQLEVLRDLFPRVSEAQLVAAVRLSEEVGYGVIEMILEDPSLDQERVIAEAAWMNALYFQHLSPR